MKGKSLYILKEWWDAATVQEWRALSKTTGYSSDFLRQIAHLFRRPSPAIAGLIARSGNAIRSRSPEAESRLPKMSRGDLCEACNECPFFKAGSCIDE